MNKRAIFLGAVALALTTSFASAAPDGIQTLNDLLADTNGMTLYTFDNDAEGMSNCYGQCASNWPPLFAGAYASAEADFSLIKRQDGKMQWAHDGKPLYLWINDAQPGDTNGDGIGGVWHIIAK